MNRQPVTTESVVATYRQVAANAQVVAIALEGDAHAAFTDAASAYYGALVSDLASAYGAAQRLLVQHLRDNGVPWTAVGRTLGISAQAAHQRFAHYDRDMQE